MSRFRAQSHVHFERTPDPAGTIYMYLLTSSKFRLPTCHLLAIGATNRQVAEAIGSQSLRNKLDIRRLRTERLSSPGIWYRCLLPDSPEDVKILRRIGPLVDSSYQNGSERMLLGALPKPNFEDVAPTRKPDIRLNRPTLSPVQRKDYSLTTRRRPLSVQGGIWDWLGPDA